MKSTRPNTRAEANFLRATPRNRLSFYGIDDRCRTVVSMPKARSREFWESHRLGSEMALELISALRADERGASLCCILHDPAPHWKDVIMRNAFFQMLEIAIVESAPPPVLADIVNERERRIEGSMDASDPAGNESNRSVLRSGRCAAIPAFAASEVDVRRPIAGVSRSETGSRILVA